MRRAAVRRRPRTLTARRIELLLAWFFGDIFKAVLYTLRRAPVQFLLCTAVQLLVDLLLAHQLYVYRPRALPRRRGADLPGKRRPRAAHP